MGLCLFITISLPVFNLFDLFFRAHSTLHGPEQTLLENQMQDCLLTLLTPNIKAYRFGSSFFTQVLFQDLQN